MLDYVEIDGVKIINTTPHKISFDVNGEQAHVTYPGYTEVTDPETGKVTVTSKNPNLINAFPQERSAGKGPGGVELVNTVFSPAPESLAKLNALREKYPDAVIVGSIIAAQAFPGFVYGMTPASGFERVAIDQKRMNPHKWTVFADTGNKSEFDRGYNTALEACREQLATGGESSGVEFLLNFLG